MPKIEIDDFPEKLLAAVWWGLAIVISTATGLQYGLVPGLTVWIWILLAYRQGSIDARHKERMAAFQRDMERFLREQEQSVVHIKDLG